MMITKVLTIIGTTTLGIILVGKLLMSIVVKFAENNENKDNLDQELKANFEFVKEVNRICSENIVAAVIAYFRMGLFAFVLLPIQIIKQFKRD